MIAQSFAVLVQYVLREWIQVDVALIQTGCDDQTWTTHLALVAPVLNTP